MFVLNYSLIINKFYKNRSQQMQDNEANNQDSSNIQYLDYRLPANHQLLRQKLKEQEEAFKMRKMNIQRTEQSSESEQEQLALQQELHNQPQIEKKNSSGPQVPPQVSGPNPKDLSFNDSRSADSSILLPSTQDNQHSSRTRQSWPEFSLYYPTCKVTLTYRQFYEFSADILVLPFKTLDFEFQPTCFFKQILTDLSEKLEKLPEGELLMLPIQRVHNYRFAALMKMEKQCERGLAMGVANVIKIIALNEKKKIRTVAFCVCEKLACVEEMTQAIIHSRDFKSIKELEFTYLFKKQTTFKQIYEKIYQKSKLASTL